MNSRALAAACCCTVQRQRRKPCGPPLLPQRNPARQAPPTRQVLLTHRPCSISTAALLDAPLPVALLSTARCLISGVAPVPRTHDAPAVTRQQWEVSATAAEAVAQADG